MTVNGIFDDTLKSVMRTYQSTFKDNDKQVCLS